MRSISVCHVDHDLRGSLRASWNERRLLRLSEPSATLPRQRSTIRRRGSSEARVRAAPLPAVRRQVVVRLLAGDEAVERATHLERGFACVVVTGADFDHHAGPRGLRR